MIFKLLPLAFGAYFAYAGLGSLALAACGTPVEALVDETVVKAVKEVPSADGSPPTYVMRTKVAYHFEVCPQGKDGPCAKAEGSDTRILSTPYSVLPQDRGYGAPVVFLPFAPGINALRQPKHLVVYGLLELLLGLAIVVFEVKVILRERREAASASETPAPEPPADPWHDLGQPLTREQVKPAEPDDGISAS